MRMQTFGPVSPGEVGRALDQALAALGVPAKLVVLYAPIDLDAAALLGPLAERTAAPLVGATHGGVAFTERGGTTDGLVGAVLGGDLDVEVGLVRGLGDRLAPRVRALVAGMMPRHPVVTALVLCDAFACDGEELVEALGCGGDAYWRFFGGFAGDGQTYRGTQVFCGGEAHTDALVMVALGSAIPARIRALHGFEVAPYARPLRVTAAEGNVVRRIEDRPAAEVYREELGRLGIQLREDQNLLSQMVCHSLGVTTALGEGLKVRAPLRLAPDGSMVLGGSIAAGEAVHVVRATAQGILDAARRLSREMLDEPGGEPVRAHFVVDCGIRRLILGDRYPRQIEAFQGRHPHPMLGFASYGEIARHGGSMQGFHNATAVNAVW